MSEDDIRIAGIPVTDITSMPAWILRDGLLTKKQADESKTGPQLRWRLMVAALPLRVSEKAVGLAIWGRTKKDDERANHYTAYPGIGTIRRDTSLSRSSVIRALPIYRRYGLWWKQERKLEGKGAADSNLYTLAWPVENPTAWLLSDTRGGRLQTLGVVSLGDCPGVRETPECPSEDPTNVTSQRPASPGEMISALSSSLSLERELDDLPTVLPPEAIDRQAW